MRQSSLVLISCLTIASISCGEASRKDLLPRNTGSKGEVAVVAPDGVWKTSTGDTLGVSMDQLSTNDGHVVHGNNRLSYGSLVEKAATITLDFEPKLKEISEYKTLDFLSFFRKSSLRA